MGPVCPPVVFTLLFLSLTRLGLSFPFTDDIYLTNAEDKDCIEDNEYEDDNGDHENDVGVTGHKWIIPGPHG